MKPGPSWDRGDGPGVEAEPGGSDETGRGNVKVFLTGGTGLLGSHVAQRLRSEGTQVVALHRSSSDTRFLASLGCELREGDLLDPPERTARAMAGCEAVVHAAAYIYGGPSLEVVREVNVHGTRNIVRGARRAGLRRMVYLSSVAVYGDPPGPMDETTPLDAPLRPRDYYGRTKREAEEVVREAHGREGLSVTILRPPALYGERDRLFVPQLRSLLRWPLVFVLGTGRTLLAAVYAGNAAQAVEAALAGRGAGEAFNITRDVDLTQRDLLEALAPDRAFGPRFISIPGDLARWGALWADRLGLTIPGARDLSLTRVVRLSTEDNPYPSVKARRVLEWRPPFTLEEALARTRAWAWREETSG